MSERFEDRLWLALESTVPSIRQEPMPRRRRTSTTRRRSLAMAAAVVVVAAVASVLAWQRGTADVHVGPASRGDGDRVDHLSFPASFSPRRDRTPQLTAAEIERAGASEQRFLERQGYRNRASLTVGLSVVPPSPATDLVTPRGVPVDVTVRTEGDTATTLSATWDIGGRHWFVRNGDPAQGQHLLDDRELLAFIDSVTIVGGRAATSDPRFVEAPRPQRRREWAVTTPTGDSLDAERWSSPDLADVPGVVVPVRGTAGVLTRDLWSDAVGGSPTAVLRWVEDGLVMSLTVLRTGRDPIATSDIVAMAESLVGVSTSEFEAMPFDPGVGWGGDGEVVVRVPPLDSWPQETLSINTLQRTRQGATLPGSRLGLGLSRVGQAWLPDTVAVRAAADAAEIVIWIGDGPEPPACARVVPVRSGQPPDVIDIDPTCAR